MFSDRRRWDLDVHNSVLRFVEAASLWTNFATLIYPIPLQLSSSQVAQSKRIHYFVMANVAIVRKMKAEWAIQRM